MLCSQCGTTNRAGRKFCSQCGSPLAASCPSCGSQNEPTDRFCGECGTVLESEATVTQPGPVPQAPIAERRLVSVLFADLVGFTSVSEARDAEDVRDLLSSYFEASRKVIERYGGTVEKFIGDAVMAVWGVPITQEDDAERAVRASLELVQAVSGLRSEVSEPDLNLRAAVVTGEAAATLGASGEGMVAGDLVNTASRLQTAARPGTVLVSESTRRATEAAIDFEDAGLQSLKGKEEPVRAWRALRVVAGRRGALRSATLEAPFVGRDRELLLIKELFHATAESTNARLVLVSGAAGIGKSRLAWEFEKYIDGLIEDVWWHRGRCLAYGEGVTYWALAEMVRMRAQIAEGEDPENAATKLTRAVNDFVSDPEERDWIEPRLKHLLGLESRVGPERDELFSAWRMLFERMADQGPTVLVFEDLQWADPTLLDFVDHLLDWSRSHAIYVLALARPEFGDRRPEWLAGRRNVTTLYLEPLSKTAMDDLLQGLVPGLPDDLVARIRDRAEGMPLYAVETVRMLLDRELLVRDGSQYRLAGPVEELEVPETLHALIAARLDGLSDEERRVLQNASVLGKSFTQVSLATVTGMSAGEVESILASLVRKQLLTVHADPRSPERGQYGFLQSLLQRVAYETLSRKDRKSRHLAFADHLMKDWESAEEEIIELIASHYVQAHHATPDAPDAPAIKTKAATALARAGQRAASLAASEQAQRYFAQAADLTDESSTRAELLEQAGVMAWKMGDGEHAGRLLQEAVALFESTGATHPAARASARWGEVLFDQGRAQEALDRMESAFSVLSVEESDEDVAVLAAEIARFHMLSGTLDTAEQRVDIALDVAELLQLPEVLSSALITKASILSFRGKREEPLALLRHALTIATESDAATSALRAYLNLNFELVLSDRYEEADHARRMGLDLARKVGHRFWESVLIGATDVDYYTGKWDEALADFSLLRAAEITGYTSADPFPIIQINLNRGSLEQARRICDHWVQSSDPVADFQLQPLLAASRASILRAEGRFDEAVGAAEEAIRLGAQSMQGVVILREGFVLLIEAALELGDLDKAQKQLNRIETLKPGHSSPYLRAQAARLRARVAASSGETETVGSAFAEGARQFDQLKIPFWHAVTLLEHAEWLIDNHETGAAPPLLEEAREIFERLAATPWLERADKARNAAPAAL